MKKLTILIIAMLLAVVVHAESALTRYNTGVAGRQFKKVYSATAVNGVADVEIVPEPAGMLRAKARAEAEEELIPVTVVTTPDKEGLNARPFSIDLIRADGVSWNEMFLNVAVLNVPKGEYLLQVMFVDGGLSMLCFPGIVVDKPLEMEVNRDMATNSLALAPVLPDGSALLLPERDDSGKIINDDYNALHFNGELTLRYKGMSKGSYIMEADTENSPFRSELRIHTNIDDGQASFCWLVDFVTRDGAHPLFYVSEPCVGGEENRVVSNDFSKYHKVGLDIKHSPVYETAGNGNSGCSVMFSIYNDNDEQLQGKGFWSAAPVDLYLCNDLGEYDDTYALAYISSLDMMSGFSPLGTEAPGLAYKDGEPLFVSNQNGNIYATPLGEGDMMFPMNPYFSFDGFPGMVFGNSSACCVVGSQIIDWGEKPFQHLFVANYYGNAGETRDADARLAEAEVIINGEVVMLRAASDMLFEWEEQRSLEEHDNARVSYVFYDENIAVDGVKGSNVCTVTIDENNDDKEAPTLQRVMLRDRSGVPSVHFDSPADGVLSIAGGDFVANQYEKETAYGKYNYIYYTYAPATLLVEYAPRGNDEFLPIEVTEDASRFFMPGYGAYWEGSLGAIDRVSPDGWFDLRVTITDDAGNSQMQVISPAFNIKDLASVDLAEADDPEVRVRVENGCIIAPEDAAVFDVAGRRVGNMPGCGIYIVVVDGRSVKVVI